MSDFSTKVPEFEDLLKPANKRVLCGVARKHLRFNSMDDIEDVVQASLLKVWKELDRVRGKLISYAIGVTRFTALNWHGEYGTTPPAMVDVSKLLVMDKRDDVLTVLSNPERTLGDVERLLWRLSPGQQQTYQRWKARGFAKANAEGQVEERRITVLKRALRKAALAS